ncbi:uncharacterized protein LOC127359610 isoform X1 [Dicentrarchus labrax]|uniref:uncharacterized protein LOC127359610 isoform X1 n=1 Tax=Dicentrarchus labrax TaxID=13489 RepID=UPI0021F67B2C|nr:uncharacterized protein LOC127359610 isoform X1 [Dicentrarchus labrax]
MSHFRNFVFSFWFLFWTWTVCLTEGVWTSDGGQPRVVGSLQPIVAVLGDDVILPCCLQPSLNVERLTVEWSKPDLKPDPSDRLSRVDYVHLYRDRREDMDMKLQSYVGRTELSKDGLKSGDISLKILNVTLEDGGRYRCFIPKLKGSVKESVVTLVVGQPRVVGSLQPIVTVLGDDVILPCRLQPSLNVERLTVEWSRPDLKPDPSDRLGRVNYVHLHRGGHDNLDMKLRSYVGRTELSKDGLKSGDISLKILNVTLEDGGRYRCFIPKLKGPVKESVVTLVVGQPRVVGSLQPIVTVLGDDVILPCRLQPSLNVELLTVEWSRPDLKPDPSDRLGRVDYVYLYRGRREDTDMKLQSYVGRTELSKDGLKNGDISLKILNVTLEDGGRYRCFIPKLKGPVKESVVTLVVEPNSVQTTTEMPLDDRDLQTPDPNNEINVRAGRLYLFTLIPSLVIIFLLLLAYGVGETYLRGALSSTRP